MLGAVLGFGSISEALGFEKSFATDLADAFFDLLPIPGPGKITKAFKALRVDVKFADSAKNIRSAVTAPEISNKEQSLGRAMLKAGNKFAEDVVKEARETIIDEFGQAALEAAAEVTREGAVSVLEAAFGDSVAQTTETFLDITESFLDITSPGARTQKLFSVFGGSRRTMKQGMPRFGLNKGGTIQTTTRSDPGGADAATLSMEFGVANGQSYRTFLNKVKTEGILTASNGFDINEFGLLDDSTITLHECTRSVSHDNGIKSTASLTCGGSNCGSGCIPSSGSTSGTVSDGAGIYQNNANCWWMLATSPGVEIQLKFPSIETESGKDFLNIYRCSSASCSSQTQIDQRSGSLGAPIIYTSMTGFLKVTFTSDGLTSKSGFSGTWNLVDISSSFSDAEDCKVIYVGAPVRLNVRIVIMRNTPILTESKKNTLLAAVSKACGFVAAADESTSRVQISQTVDMLCASGLGACSQVDFSITATTNEMRTTLQSKMSLQSLEIAHSSLGVRRSVSSGIVSFEICNGLCGACPLGKYGTVSGSDFSSCTDCPGGKYSDSQAATSDTSCVPCPSNSHSPSGSYNIWNCTCINGFILSATHTCTVCESGKYSASLSTSCTTCPSDMTSPQGSTAVDDCKCAAGTFINVQKARADPLESPCTVCEAGKYSNATALMVCTNCEAGKFSAAVGAMVASTCTDCPQGKTSVAGSAMADNCRCAPGWTVTVAGCTKCSIGTFKMTTGAASCVACPANSHSPETGQSSCQCNAGFTGPEGDCSSCVAGKFKATSGSAACENCEAGKFSAAVGAIVASTCADCPQGKTSVAGSSSANNCATVCDSLWNTGQSSCQCNAGFTGTDGDCSSCVAGKFKASLGPAACENCEAGKYAAAAASTVCTNCEAGKYKVSAGVGVCLVCPSQSSSLPGSHFCPCIAGSVSSASAAKSCVCDAGFTLDAASSGEICIPCPTGTCKPSPGDHPCDTSFCPLESPKISPNGGMFAGFVEIIVTAKVPMVVTLNDAEPVCSSSRVKNHTLTLLSSTTVQARACFESRESGVSIASFKVLPGSVVKISFTMDGINADELKTDVIDKFVEAFANELGIAKERISNLNFKNARRRLSMSFELVASSAADAKLLSTMVYRHRHTQPHVTKTKQLHIMISVCSFYLVFDATSSFT